MNYYDESGKLIGFETEFAEAVCKKLGVEPKFQVIDWEQKENELKSRTIDVIWNGLTVTEERKENMAFSTAYVSNKQVIVIKDSNAAKYATVEGMAGASCVAENGSAGETAIKTNAVLSQNKYVAAAGQKDALLEVKAGTSEIAVVDLVMALASVDKGDYKDLMIVEGVELTAEEYAIGCRLEDSELLAKINAAIDEMVADGSLAALAEKYGLADVYAFKK
jgi:polar amino acid transport system substrate-binding protein